MAAREKMFKEKTKQISYQGLKSTHAKVKAYAHKHGKYLGVAYAEIINAGIEAIERGKQLELPLK